MTENRVVRTFRQGSVVIVDELLAVEGQQTLEDAVTDTTSTNGANNLALEIVGVASNLRDHPVSTLDHLRITSNQQRKARASWSSYLVCWNKVPDKQEDRHHNVLSDGDDIRT